MALFDLKWLRENAEAFDQNLRKRHAAPAAAGLQALDAERRRIETELQEFQSTRNRLSKSFGQAKAKGEPFEHLQAELTGLKDKVKAGEDRLAAVQAELDTSLATFPNILQPDVPDGADRDRQRRTTAVGCSPELCVHAAAA